jgi:hypothetical protein
MTLYIHDGLNTIKFVFPHIICPPLPRVFNFRLMRTEYTWTIKQSIKIQLLKLKFLQVFKQEQSMNYIIVLAHGIETNKVVKILQALNNMSAFLGASSERRTAWSNFGSSCEPYENSTGGYWCNTTTKARATSKRITDTGMEPIRCVFKYVLYW